MHDLDRTTSEFEFDNAVNPSSEYESYEGPFLSEFSGEGAFETLPFNEVEEMELAAELLTVSNEAELDQFLGSLLKKAGKAAGRFMNSSMGRSLGGALKGIAKTALPLAGSAIGTAIMPGIGTAVGGALGNMGTNLFGEELEGLHPDEMEFETARRFVRFAGSAATNAIQNADGDGSPEGAAQGAITRAARRHAPGLLRQRGRRGQGRPPMYGNRPPAFGTNGAGALSPEEEYEAASDLVGVASEFDLDNVLGSIVEKAAERTGVPLKRGVGRQLTGALKGIARQTLPAVKRATSNGYDVGDAVRGVADAAHLAQKAGRMFGLELEGLSTQDQEFEAARRVVRLASSAGSQAAKSSRTSAPASQVARSAMVDAARKHAPGLLSSDANNASARGRSDRSTGTASRGGETGDEKSGRWIRRGTHIILVGAGA